MTGRRYTIHEAAAVLGISVEATRKRAARGALRKEKDEDGTVYVWLDVDQPVTGLSPDYDQTLVESVIEAKDETIEELRRQVEFQRRELERKDTIIMALTQRVPEIQPPTEQRESDLTAHSAGQGKGTEDTIESPESHTERSWWRRIFGG